MMILQRLAKQIREQNWFTVIIEILIVVIGIFIGLQVTEWNNHRKLNDQSQQFLIQLDLDIESSILSMKKAIADHEKLITNGKLALQFLNNGGIFEENKAEIEFAFQKMHEVPKPHLLHGNLYSLMTGDGWFTVTDSVKQIRLRHLTGELGNKIDIYRDIESNITAATATHRQLIGFSIPKDEDIPIYFDKEVLLNSAGFKIAMQNAIVFHWWGARMLNHMITSLEEYKTDQSKIDNELN